MAMAMALVIISFVGILIFTVTVLGLVKINNVIALAERVHRWLTFVSLILFVRCGGRGDGPRTKFLCK